jgi:hypothetical protein
MKDNSVHLDTTYNIIVTIVVLSQIQILDAMELHSAIPSHLETKRTLPVQTPPNYNPPFPAYAAHFPKHTKDLTMAIIGAQQQTSSSDNNFALKLQGFVDHVAESIRPRYWEWATSTDSSGAFNKAIIVYWENKDKYLKWASESGFEEWWQALDPEKEPHGWFKEIFFPTVERLETVFSNNEASEGIAYMREKMSGPLREHVYWGSMRDRLPVAQTDPLAGTKWPNDDHNQDADTKESNKKRIRVPGRKNLAIIRSGQDWSDTNPVERKLYLETMHPVLIKGMDFLRDHGEEVGCISNRFMTVVDSTNVTSSTDKTFGLGYFNDLASLEGWSKLHKTHLDIFGRFLQYAKELQGNISLRLFHEVLVLESEQQEFEYVACHPGTGMLMAL